MRITLSTHPNRKISGINVRDLQAILFGRDDFRVTVTRRGQIDTLAPLPSTHALGAMRELT